jgi:hypothetical protein
METHEWVFATQGIACQRVDLTQAGARAHMRMLAAGRTLLRTSAEPTRLVVGHKSLLLLYQAHILNVEYL